MHGAVTSGSDTLTGSGVGQTYAIAAAPNPTFPLRWHVFSNWVCTGTVVGAVLTFDIQALDGTFVDSGMPSVSLVGTALKGTLEGFISSAEAKGVRLRISGWTGGTNCVITTSMVSFV
jgi:hypothetical protein